MIYLFIALFFILLSLRYNIWRIPKSYKIPRVLMYHSIHEHLGEKHDKWRVRPKDFEKQMAWFYKNKWHSYTISELTMMDKIPNKSFVLTFDDGYEDNYFNAFPILKKYHFKATIYLVPNHKENIWERENTSKLSNLLNNEQILKMQKSNLIEFGSHTLSHTNLSLIDDETLLRQLVQSKKHVEDITKKHCYSFAYPYGKFNDKIIRFVKNAGYKNAVIVKRGLYVKENPFAINRVGILGTESFFDFWLKITRVRNKL